MRTNWTPKEEQILIKNVKYYPHNLTEAFRVTSTQTNRSIKACQHRWYGDTSNKVIGLRNNSPVFMTISGKTNIVNRKIVTENTSDNTIKSNNSIWKKLLSLFKL